MKKKISLLHPFTPGAAGVVEASVPRYHSRPHTMAMEQLGRSGEFECTMEYFTSKYLGYEINGDAVGWKFFPVTRRLNGDHRKWKKQGSRRCLRYYEKDTPDLTIINMSGHSSLFSFELSKVIRARGKRYIAMLGGRHYSDTFRNREYYRNAHHILVHTHAQKSEMGSMELFGDADIRVFPLGVDCSVFKPSDEPRNENRPRTVSLLYVGRIVEWKRVHMAIEALNKLKVKGLRGELKIVGPVSSDPYLAELKTLATYYGVQDDVVFVGHKEHHELPEYFRNADLLLLPSENETFGMVMVESMACGTPVAAVHGPGGPAEVISDGVDGLLSPAEFYAEAVAELCSDSSKLIRLKRRSRVKAVEEYSIEATSNALRNSVNIALN